MVVANWTVTGTNRTYSVAGLGSRRIEDNDASIVYSGSSWTELRGNYSGGTIQQTSNPGDSLSCSYQATQSHTLYAGLRYTGTGGVISIAVDGQAAVAVNLAIPGEDVLFRYSLGSFAVGSHTVVATHAGAAGTNVYFDFLELACPDGRRSTAGTGEVSLGRHPGNRLGHAALHLAPSRAHSVDTHVAQFHRAGTSLCWRPVVL